MHDELLERRLRTTLRDEAKGVAFTITAAELERRAALRSRGRVDRRLGLLLAAAVGVGLVGVGGALSGQITFAPGPSPTPSATEAVPSPSPSLQGPVALPDLDDLLTDVPAASVVIAQAHGPADGPEHRNAGEELGAMAVHLGEVQGSTAYEVTVACQGDRSGLEFDIRLPLSRGPRSGPDVPCDGSVHTTRVDANGPREISFQSGEDASWRVVIRRLDGAAEAPPVEAPILDAGTTLDDQFVFRYDETIEPGNAVATVAGLAVEEIGLVTARKFYRVQVWCVGGDAIRYIHGDFIFGDFVPTTSTHVACDGAVHGMLLDVPEPNGSHVYVAADPETHWSVLTTSDLPPVDIVWERPGWVLTGGGGPDLSFSTTTMSFTGQGVEGGGQVMIVMDCAGVGTIEVIVDVGIRNGERQESFVATCTPEGSINSHIFDVESSFVDVTWPMPAGMWTAMSILVPDPATTP